MLRRGDAAQGWGGCPHGIPCALQGRILLPCGQEPMLVQVPPMEDPQGVAWPSLVPAAAAICRVTEELVSFK